MRFSRRSYDDAYNVSKKLNRRMDHHKEDSLPNFAMDVIHARQQRQQEGRSSSAVISSMCNRTKSRAGGADTLSGAVEELDLDGDDYNEGWVY